MSFRPNLGSGTLHRLAHGAAAGCLCFALLPGRASAQPAQSLYLGVDTAFQAVRDDTLEPLAFSGPRLELAPRHQPYA